MGGTAAGEGFDNSRAAVSAAARATRRQNRGLEHQNVLVEKLPDPADAIVLPAALRSSSQRGERCAEKYITACSGAKNRADDEAMY